MQHNLFPRKILDELGSLGGATGTRSIRAEDGLNYVVKDDIPGVPKVRASEFVWLSLAHSVGLACPHPEVFEEKSGRLLVGTRREHTAVGKDAASCTMELLAGTVHDGGRQLSRLYAYDLFVGNWDRHPGNYLVLEDGGAKVVFAIDFSHVVLDPTSANPDPTSNPATATRSYFPRVVAPYSPDVAAAVEIVDRLGSLPIQSIEAILTAVPDPWLTATEKSAVLTWWDSPPRPSRAAAIKQGLQDGTYI